MPGYGRQIKCVMQQLLAGVRYLHHVRIIHGDLTPCNLLFDEQGVLKIGGCSLLVA